MSIRFRLFKAPNKVTYASIIRSYRDENGVSRTKSLKTYGAVTEDILEDVNFKKQVEEDLAFFKENINENKRLKTKNTPQKISFRYYYGIVLYRYVWEKLSLNEFFRTLEQKYKNNCDSLELLTFYELSMLLFNANTKGKFNKTINTQHIFDFSAINLKNVPFFLRVLAKEKVKILNKSYKVLSYSRSFAHKETGDTLDILEKKVSDYYYFTKYNYFNKNQSDLKVDDASVSISFKTDSDLRVENFELFFEQGGVEEKNKEREFFIKQEQGIENKSSTVVVADTIVNDHQGVIELEKQGIDYILVRNMYKFPKEIHEELLSEKEWYIVYNKKGHSSWRYKELSYSFWSEHEKLNDNTRVIAIFSKSKRAHDLEKLDRNYEVAEQIVKASQEDFDDEEDILQSSHFNFNKDLMKLLKRQDGELKRSLEIDVNTYNQRGNLAGYFIIATSLKDVSIEDLYKKVRNFWRLKEQYREFKVLSWYQFEEKWDKDFITSQLVISHLLNLIQNYIVDKLTKNGMILSSKMLREALSSEMLVPVEIDKTRYFLKTLSPVTNFAEDNVPLMDKILQMFNLKPLDSLEKVDSLVKKLNIELKLRHDL